MVLALLRALLPVVGSAKSSDACVLALVPFPSGSSVPQEGTWGGGGVAWPVARGARGF